MTVEKSLERKLCTEIKKRKGIALKFYCLTFTGMPDRMVLVPYGKIFFAEMKSTGKKLSPRQRLIKKWLESLGFRVWVIDSEEVLLEFLKTVDLVCA